MPASTPRVHDRFFKQIFTRPENVRDFIITYLPSTLDHALESVLFAQDKFEVLGLLR